MGDKLFMEMLSKLSRFTFPRNYYATWNALMAAYSFEQLSLDQKQQVMDNATEIESSTLEQPIDFNKIVANRSKAQLNYLYSLAFIRLGIQPALGRDPWYEVKIPHIAVNINKNVATTIKHKLEKQYNVVFPTF